MGSLQAAIVAFSLLGAQETVLVDFHADWCGPCRQMGPTIDQLSAAGYPVRKVNIDQDRALAAQFRVQSIPCFVLLVDGKEVDRCVGATSYAELQAMLQRAGVAPGGQGGRARGQSPDYAPPAQAMAPLVPVTLPGAPSEAPLSQALASNDVGAARDEQPAPAAATPECAVTPEALLAASVRLKVTDPDGNSCGSGTIVDAREGEALVLTCGHIFRDSQGKGEIRVDLFGPDAPKGVKGEVLFFQCDDRGDIALVSIRPGVPVTPAPVAPAAYQPQPGHEVATVGCNHGADPTIERGKIASLDKYLGPPNIQVTGQPVEGRSGGGLFSREGYVIGVCNAADPTDNQGLYAGLAAIQQTLDRLHLKYVYQSPAGGESPAATLASNEGSIERAATASAAPGGDSDWRPVEPPAMAASMPAPEQATAAAADLAASTDRAAQPYLPAALVPAAHRPGPASSVNVINTSAAAGNSGSAELSPQERAALAAVERHAGGAEVICIVRPLADPRAKSEIIVLDKASPQFLEQLAAEKHVQDSRHLTSHTTPRARTASSRYRLTAAPRRTN